MEKAVLDFLRNPSDAVIALLSDYMAIAELSQEQAEADARSALRRIADLLEKEQSDEGL